MVKRKRSAPTVSGVPFFERLHVLHCDFLGIIPHDQLYVCCKDEDWPQIRLRIVEDHPELFDHERIFGNDVG